MILESFWTTRRVLHKPIRVGNFCSIYYLEYESNDDRDKDLPIEEYIN